MLWHHGLGRDSVQPQRTNNLRTAKEIVAMNEGEYRMSAQNTARMIIAALIVTGGLSVANLAAASPAERMWSRVPTSALDASADRLITPLRFESVVLRRAVLDGELSRAPHESAEDADLRAVVVPLPTPDGGFANFRVVESPIMEPGLAARFPQIRTYRGRGIDDPSATVRMDRTPHGFHAMVMSSAGSYFVDPYSRGDLDTHIVYNRADLVNSHEGVFSCGVASDELGGKTGGNTDSVELSGDSLRTYRLVVAATGEYTSFHGGTVLDGMSAIVTAINRVNQIYEREVAIRMVLVANNDLVVYTDGASDPYSNNSGYSMLGQNQSNLDAVIGSSNYDMGHVFSTGGGGIANLRAVCNNSYKAQGVTGLPNPVGDPFYVDYVAHEMGHQWGGNHTFNGSYGACSGGNRNPTTAYEPGSGSTIMAYAGICGSHNIQNFSDDYFHGASFSEIVAYSAGGVGSSCAEVTPTGNTPPVVEAGGSFTIPVSTPFALCGSAVDPDGDVLTYGWEEFDLGPAGHPNTPSGNAPIFRSFEPTDSPERLFPRTYDLVNNVQTKGEILPSYSRNLNFRLTARDNFSGGGGVGYDTTSLVVSDAGGPFVVTAPDTAVTWTGGTTQVVSWDVAGTDLAPINCDTVDIALSVDGGVSFPLTLLSETPNDGSQAVMMPDLQSATSRVRVSCHGHVFFDISNANFTLTGSDVHLFAEGTDSCGGGWGGWTSVVQ